MRKVPRPVPIAQPPAPPQGLAADVIAQGPPLHPAERIKLFSDKQWELFVQEWVDSLGDQYDLVERCGGSGDMGRDVIARVKGGNGIWDNYQCKHYKESLKPSDIWIELGKLAYYSFRGDYTYPRHYYFIAPQGAGTKLSNLLKKPEELRAELLAKWDQECRNKITKTEAIECDDAMRAYIATLNFAIFEATPVLRIIDAHRKTRWYVARFGGGLPQRPADEQPPSVPAPKETVFVRELRRAYADHIKKDVNDIGMDLVGHEHLREHFADARIEFYSAESLRTFSRDTLPPGEFERLQDEVHAGIRDDLRDDHADGYRRLKAVVRTARLLPLDGHSLHGRVNIRDRGGICHQLANDEKVRWVK
jgi:hypothetical protein